MTTLVLDTGALIALDRDQRSVWAMLRVASDDASPIAVPAGVVGQAWRDGARQAVLARALRHCDEVTLDSSLARASGILCGHTATADVIGASVAVTAAGLARRDDVAILTSDPADLRLLGEELQSQARIVTV